MITTNRLVYLELHKTGCSHIRRLLREHFGGEDQDKHNRARLSQIEGKFVLGSIRNPWDWYVSLWAFGLSGRGALRRRVSERFSPSYYHRQLPKELGKNWLTPMQLFRSVTHDLVKPVDVWGAAYSSVDDATAFRSWLKLLLDPDRRYDVGEGFAFSPLSGHSGLLTYRYFRLFTLGNAVFADRRLKSSAGLADFDSEETIVDGFVRTERLEDDLLASIKRAGHEIDSSIEAAIRTGSKHKTNISVRREADYYFDEETIDLVASRDSHLVNKFGYQYPR